MSKKIRIIRVDPVRQRLTYMEVRPSLLNVRNVIRASQIGAHDQFEFPAQWPNAKGGFDEIRMPLTIGARTDVDEMTHGFRLRGGEDTCGVAVLFGRGPAGGMAPPPVTREWVQRHLIWIRGEQELTDAQRLQGDFPEEVREALLGAIGGMTDHPNLWAIQKRHAIATALMEDLDLIGRAGVLTPYGMQVRERMQKAFG